MADGEWYYARNNQQQGPVPLHALQEMAHSGQLQPGDLVWRQGMPNWLPAAQVPELAAAPAAPAPAPSAPAYPPPPQQVQYGGYYPPQQPQYAAPVPSYLAQSVLCTLFCCVPFGVVAIIYAAQVGSKLGVGDYPGAMAASQNAKMWCWISFGLGLTVIVGWFFLAIVGAAAQP